MSDDPFGSWRDAMHGQREAFDSIRNPPKPPEDRLVATFKVTFAELGATGEDTPVDLYRALRDMARRTAGGAFAPRGPVPDVIRAIAASAKGLKEVTAKANGLSREEAIQVRGILDSAARRVALEDVSQPVLRPLQGLVLAWEQFSGVRTNDPRSAEEKKLLQRSEHGWINY